MSKQKFELNGLATAIGSMPHIDPQDACSVVLANLPEIPPWPQLPKRSSMENMYTQYSEGFPGLVLEKDSIWVDRSRDHSEQLERLYTAYLENDTNYGTIGHEYAEGLHTYLDSAAGSRVWRLRVR